MIYNIPHIKRRESNTNPNKDRGWTHVLEKVKQFLLHMWHPSCYSYYQPGDKSWMWLRQTDHIRCHLWHRYYWTVHQVTTAKPLKLQLQPNPWFSSSLVRSTPQFQNHTRNHTTLECRINWETHTPHTDVAVTLLYINGKFKMGKLKSPLLS